MAEYSYQNIRSYEISIWTLRDRFISILKWANMDQKGQVQNPEIILRDDGTQELSFTIPQYYQQDFDRIPNPLWIHLDQQPLIANMHKLKVIFNKNTEDEAILEFLVVSVTEDHTRDEVNITVKAEGLAFHELGKTGYKIKVSQENFEQAQKKWFEEGSDEAEPQMTLQFWNDLIFKTSKGKWRTNWTYEIQMDWSSYGGMLIFLLGIRILLQLLLARLKGCVKNGDQQKFLIVIIIMLHRLSQNNLGFFAAMNMNIMISMKLLAEKLFIIIIILKIMKVIQI